MDIDFPFQFNEQGRTATTDADDHLRDMIELVLFSSPGERVNRPDFGSGLQQMVFGINSDSVAAALQVNIQASLERWLGDLIEIQNLHVQNDDATLFVRLSYLVSRTKEQRSETFERSLVG